MCAASRAVTLCAAAGCAQLAPATNDRPDATDVIRDAPDATAERDVVDDLASPRDIPLPRDAFDVFDAPEVDTGWVRPVAPLAGSHVTQRRPTLRWERSLNATEVRVEICADRACALVEHRWTSAATADRPPEELSPGVHFWRVARGERVGPTWSFVVPPRSGEADTAWSALTDLDGDGRSDVVVITREGDAGVTLRTHFGRADDLPRAGTAFTVTREPSVRAVGDLDGDGYGDLAIRRVCVEPGSDRIEIHRGGPEGPAPTPAQAIVWSPFTCQAGYAFVGIGDVNGDGYGDLLAESPRPGTLVGGFSRRVELYLGGPPGTSLVPSGALEGGTEYTGFGQPRALGDVNGDGFADVAVVSRAGYFRGGGVFPASVFIHFGGPGGLSATPTLRIASEVPDDVGFGELPDGPFDGDGDGFADVVIGNGWFVDDPMRPAARMVVRRGGRAGLAAPSETWWLPPYTANLQGPNAMMPVDLDGDGGDELVLLATQLGRLAAVRLGAGTRIDGGAATDHGLADRALVWRSAVQAGDIDGDGRSDLLLALRAPGADAPAEAHTLELLRGGAWPRDPTTRTWLRRPAAEAMTLAP